MINPILVEIVRGGTVESVHRGAACVVDASGMVVESWGNIDALICPRSALKPLQALPLVVSGAADALKLTDEDIALACGSHSGEPMHTDRVLAWLTRVGLTVHDLECGAQMPGHRPTAHKLICEGAEPSAVHNNCSGKHTGFLCCAQHMGVPTKGYVTPDHPVQRAIFEMIGEIARWDTEASPLVIDGCSAPNLFMPLYNLALAWARMGEYARIVDAMKAHPLLMSGTGRPCAQLIAALDGHAIVKTGAEGVFAACLPDRKLGVAVKIDDGASRAAPLAITGVLKQLKAFRADANLRGLEDAPITNWRGIRTGTIRAAI